MDRYKMELRHKESSKWIDLVPKKDDNGQWVKWDDVKDIIAKVEAEERKSYFKALRELYSESPVTATLIPQLDELEKKGE